MKEIFIKFSSIEIDTDIAEGAQGAAHSLHELAAQGSGD